jgi:hypothetical protein
MKKQNTIQYFLLVCFCIISFLPAQSQVDSTFNKLLDSINLDDLFGAKEKKSYFKFQTSYLTNYVYAGRGDANNLYPYLTPLIEYNHKSGVYASASLSYLANDSSRVDVKSVELGYNFDITKKISGSAYVNKSFYASNSNNILSSSSWATGVSLSYETKYVTLTNAMYLSIGGGNSFALNVSLDHPFYFGNDSSNYSFTITPTITTVFDNTKYYQNRKTLPRRTNTSKNKFQLMCYELSLPIYYDNKNWGLFFTPAYSIATNPIVTTTQAQNPPLNIVNFTENLSNYFFAEVGFYYKF